MSESQVNAWDVRAGEMLTVLGHLHRGTGTVLGTHTESIALATLTVEGRPAYRSYPLAPGHSLEIATLQNGIRQWGQLPTTNIVANPRHECAPQTGASYPGRGMKDRPTWVRFFDFQDLQCRAQLRSEEGDRDVSKKQQDLWQSFKHHHLVVRRW